MIVTLLLGFLLLFVMAHAVCWAFLIGYGMFVDYRIKQWLGRTKSQDSMSIVDISMGLARRPGIDRGHIV